MSERIVDLEVQLMHQQRQLDELNELVYRQQQDLDRLATELRQLKDQVPSLNKSPEDEMPPPHY
jgi:uncharacterized coiled-coil protein SlyX